MLFWLWNVYHVEADFALLNIIDFRVDNKFINAYFTSAHFTSTRIKLYILRL